ncbi:hypothetical protein [Microbacterium sp.]|uniref:hypothetical protein n=1 Tax=Microbacterium sp. TaxID=51671 RepID=UPI0028A1ADB4|nr:hypothetical protein [Microbacterium sp.]
MNRRLAPLAVAAALLTAGTLALSACAPEDPSASPTPSATSTRTGSATASATPSATPSETPDATCLVGDWTMGQEELVGFYDDVNELMAGAGVSFAPEGSANLTLGADGTFVWAPAATVTAAVSGTTILITFGGQIDGTYTATADHVSTATQNTAGLQVSATIDGTPTDAGAVSEEIAGAPVTDASYTCSGDTLTLESAIAGETATSVLHRR